jgi:DNA replication licensing factor MCM5
MAADRQSAYSISLFGSQREENGADGPTPSRVHQTLVDFVMEFHLDNVFIYRCVEFLNSLLL